MNPSFPMNQNNDDDDEDRRPTVFKTMKKPTFTFMSTRSWLGAPCKVGLINVYGPQSSSLKEILWSLNEHVINSNSSDAIWIVFGDSNAVRCREERVGTNFDQREASVFNDFICRFRFFDFPFGGRKFTRFDKEGSKLSKLDRFLVSPNFLETWNNAFVNVLCRIVFDHCLIVISCGLLNFGPKPFKFFDKWIENKDMMEVVADSWSNCLDDSALLRADVRDPLEFSDFRPISLIGCVYKVIYKVLATRLAKVIPSIVGPNQSVFLTRRQILDGCLIANEIIRIEKIEDHKLLLFKLDFEKAFDSVCLDFLMNIMTQIGFGFKANNLILILKCFEKASGLKMKLPKSRIFKVGIDIEDVETVASSFGCMHGPIPFMYLRLPMGKSMHFCEGWGKVVNRVRDRLSAWKAKSLSIAPDKIITLLESIHAWFFWGFKDGAHALWRKVIRGFYGEDGGFGADSYVRGYKGVWCGILKSNSTTNDIDPYLVDSFKLKVSNGSDRWGLVNGAWVGMWSWHYPPRGKALDDLASLVSLIGNLVLVDYGMDKRMWSNDASGSSRASIDRLATRLNLVNRGVSIDSYVSPFCKACGESVNHCLLIWPKNWRNKLVHAPLDDRAKVREDDIFPSIQRLSKTWISACSNIPSSYQSI
nr:hypothetical protein [Tanacetum cinerariifolium]